MRRTLRYRLYPTRQQTRAMVTMPDTHRHLYNRAPAERKAAWEHEQRSLRYEDQSAQLKAERTANPYLAQTNFSSTQATLRRLKQTFDAFFRRVKRGEKAGYPRFKGRGRFDTVEYPRYGDGCKVTGARVYFQHVGTVRIVLHRPIKGTIKTLSFTRCADSWYLIVSCDLSIARMIKHRSLAKSSADAAWNQLVSYTQYRAEGAGAVCIQIDPRGTPQRCSACATVVAKGLSVRVHQCPACGLSIDRDLNAAINVLGVGLHSLGLAPRSRLLQRASSHHLPMQHRLVIE